MLDEAQSSQRTDPELGYEVGTYPTHTAGRATYSALKAAGHDVVLVA